ncbi:hypothetical protein CROQUDRAFT_664093 [Cronartium quercuum f. sp. fusiforme G11]|uniref:Signal recognition particle receptor subunit beta n=1 Tax=Cronartium quercuum f. sp. fusiforme G11 TaxID=708437 RepID=A0A9P6N7E7_9BASI|nr:hypothetical protein CROQUDRAFT_664093 [Cronartium quercuum f. sp. fusiforme G11]
MLQFSSLSNVFYLPYILTAVLLIFCTLFIKHHFFITSIKPRSLDDDHPVIVLSGPIGSGKTKLWYKLIQDCDSIETIPTVNSHSKLVRLETERHETAEEQRRTVTPTFVTLIDTTAQPHLRAAAFASHFQHSTNVVFVIDSQVGLSGKGLRDTAESLNLVLSYLLLLSYQRVKGNLPKLAIYLDSSGSKSLNLNETDFMETSTIKIKTILNKELNRRRIASTNVTGSLSFYTTSPDGQTEGSDSYLGIEPFKYLLTLKDSIKGFLPRSKIARDQLPHDEDELMKLLDQEEEEEDRMMGLDRNLKVLERYELISGHTTHWILSTSKDPDGLKAFWSWLGHIRRVRSNLIQ